ncbi:hypothetical protein H6G97_42875 [Nostoc flagelliforme FACHB-838]|uniref:Uncharacterized protein n=1 Tax=Nostoc flagelliforme FACHB-838 TaxID=2692904 RepID=A0ABR8E393_9NOSO|nr:hypothetical protein [Nostoc flagelliforme]MBD2535745.1 hypothetical protein [Nostoc flagelliforme FACHB-838]
MNELAKEYPFVHVYAQQKPRQPVIIKASTEGLCVLLNAIVTAIAYLENNGTAEVFDGDAEAYEVIVKVVNTHDELSPVPYQIEKQ